MKHINLAVLLAIGMGACACGSNDDEEPDPADALVGKWGVELPGSPGCILAGAFTADKLYEADTICPLADGAYGVEAEIGNYGADGQVIDLVPTAASCQQANRDHNPSSVSYSVSTTTLRLVLPSGAVVMEKFEDDPNSLGMGSAVIRYGCANVDGFVRSEIAPL